MKKIISAVLAALMLLSVCTFTVGVSAAKEEQDKLFASVVGFDNFKQDSDIKGISTAGGSISNVSRSYKSEYTANPAFEHYLEISGESAYSVTIDASHLDFSAHKVGYIVLDTSSDVSDLTVKPILQNDSTGTAAQYCAYNGYSYFKLAEAVDLKGVLISAPAGKSFKLTEAYFCENEYSAKFIVDNNVTPPTTETVDVVITETVSQKSVIDMYKASQESAPHIFDNVKWPSIAIDENDKIYIVGDGARRDGHPDFNGATVLVTSEDGGNTYSEPRQIANTIADDGDVGIAYLGNGKLLLETPSGSILDYVRGGRLEEYIKANWKGGICARELADSWDSDGYPIGGFMGNYVSIVEYIRDNYPQYRQSEHFTNYTYISEDYGETWNADPLVFKSGTDYTQDMVTLAETMKYTLPDEDNVAIPTFSPHGPRVLSDGSLFIVGKVCDDVDIEANLLGCYASFDEGKSWQFMSQVPVPCDWSKYDYQEPDVVETADGVLLAAFRSEPTQTAFSYDRGLTWTTPQYTSIQGYPPSFKLMDNGDIVCVCNWRFDPYEIRVYVSKDGGRTWSKKAALSASFSSSDMGYPDSDVLSDGTIVTAYYGYRGGTSNIYATNWTYETVVAKENSWVETSKGYRYYDENLEVATKSWINDGVGLRYADADGYMAVNQSVRDGRAYRLVGPDGYTVSTPGWNKAGTSWYYVQKDGTLKTNCWMKDSKGWCFLSSSGVMLTNRIVKDTKGYCLVDASGYWVTTVGWKKAGSDWYYVQKGGYLKTGGWMKDSKGWCYLGIDGAMLKSRSLKDTKGWCLVDGSGYWVTSTGWHKVDGNWYYVQKGGYLKTGGWMKDSKGWCYLDDEGKMLTDMAVKDSTGWCILDASGYWVTKAGTYQVTKSYKNGLAAGTYKVKSNGYIDMK